MNTVRTSFFRFRSSRPLRVPIAVVVLVSCLIGLSSGGYSFGAEDATKISGAGATFPMPIYSKWAISYNRLFGVKIDYQGIGSGGGLTKIKEKSVDFGASDEPLNSKDLSLAKLIQFPMVIGGVVPVVNVPGIRRGKLKLTPEILADIFLGNITNWNDRRIVAVNQSAKLPDLKITVARREDASGTTWIFTNYLEKVSAEWREKLGHGKTVNWPVGVAGKGNPGVAAVVKSTEGAIGYVEFAYALRQNLKYCQLQNQAGKFVSPGNKSFQAAASNADWANTAGFYVILTNQPGEETWPITGASYVLIQQDQQDEAKAKALISFFEWAYKKGSDQAMELDYVPIPSKVYSLAERVWQEHVTVQGRPFRK
jgi:phosphate transport system substrate-binding protein